MQLILSIIVAVHAYPFVRAFAPLLPRHNAALLGQKLIDTRESALRATAETEAERLLRRARELREAVKAGEEELHTTLLQRKKTRDAATDSIIAQLFPKNAKDNDIGGVCALCDRLREKRLALDMLVRVVERLHEREVAARGLEHVEPSIHHEYVTFKRVAQADEVELRYVQGLVDQLIEAAEILDREFINQKSECNGKIVSLVDCDSIDISQTSHLYFTLPGRLTAISCTGEEVILREFSKTRQRTLVGNTMSSSERGWNRSTMRRRRNIQWMMLIRTRGEVKMCGLRE